MIGLLEATPLVAMAVPTIGALAIVLLGRWPNLREAATLATAGTLLYVVLGICSDQLARGAAGGNFGELYSLGNMLPGLALEFRVEALGVIYALVASSLWILNSLYSIGYMRAHHEQNQPRLYLCRNGTTCGAMTRPSVSARPGGRGWRSIAASERVARGGDASL